MKRITLFTTIAVLLVSAIPALAGVELWLGGSAGYNGFSQSDVNDELNYYSEAYHLPKNEVNSGLGAQEEFGVRVNSSLLLGVGFKRFTGDAQVFDWSGSIEYSVPANATYVLLGYTFPTESKFSYGVEGLFGSINSSTKFTLASVFGDGGSVELDGSGFFGEFRAMAGYALTPKFHLTPMVGYRVAKIDNVTVGGDDWYDIEGNSFALDYSGLTVQLGFRLFLGK